MKTRIARYLLTAVGALGLVGAPALFAGDRFDGGRANVSRFDRNSFNDRSDISRDYDHIARQNRDIRSDRRRLAEDRAALNRDYYQRGRQARDLRNDRRDDNCNDYRQGWR
jgi:hypothetical protein